MNNLIGGAESLSILQEIKNLKQENELLSSTLDMVNAKIDSMSRSSKILFKDSFDYELGTPITFNPISDQGYLVICLPTYHNINTFAYIIQLIRLKPGEKSFSVNVLWRYDGVPTTSGTFDLQFIFIPVQI